MKRVLKKPLNKKYFLTLSILIIFIVIIIIIKFTLKSPPIKIGFVNTLTGAASTGSIKMRDVVVLGVEEINKKGGINGHLIELFIKDDKFDPDVALQVDQELIDEGVVAIIGHNFSSLCLKVAPLINKHNILMIAPITMATELVGRDDNFLRLNISLNKDAELAAQVALNRLKLKKIAIIYDLVNQDLSIPTFNYFKKEFEKHGGKISASIPINSREKISAPDIIQNIIKSDAEGIYLITDAIHATLICQHLRMKNSKIKIIAHGWAFMDPVFITKGGNAIEGVISIDMRDTGATNEKFVSFEQKFTERFGEKITGPSLHAYEAMQILFYALSITDDPKKIKQTILKQKEFNNIYGKIVFDKYGDIIPSLYLLEIRNGKQKNLGKIKF